MTDRRRFEAWRERRRAARAVSALQRAEDRYDDAEHHLWKWGWASTPSEDRRERARVDALKAERDRLRGGEPNRG